MGKKSSRSDASPSTLGYLHQCRCALLLALQRDDTPELELSIEKFDDISVHDPSLGLDGLTELRQHKLHVSRRGNLGNKSTDVWKTLHVWSDHWSAGRLDLDRVHLCLVTTSEAGDDNAIRWLRPAPHPRDPEQARRELERAGAASDSDVVQKAVRALLNLPDDRRQALFRAVSLLDGGLDAAAVRAAIRRCVWAACVEKHRDAFVDRLEGWWLNLVVEHLSAPTVQTIPIRVVQQMVHDIGGHYRRESLPDDLLAEPIPADGITATGDTNFVRQLALIGLSPVRQRLALEDHYRAFTQRSRWVKEQLLGFNEEVKYEERLVAGWRERFVVMAEGVTEGSDAPTLARHGMGLYDWVATEAGAASHLRFRSDFPAEYMAKGSYHMLADRLRVGWHPEYAIRLAPPPPPPPAPPPAAKPARRRKGAAK